MEGLMSLIHNHAIPVSATILLVAYIFIATEKIPKVTVALLGAALTLILGLLGQDKLVNGVFDHGYFINFVDFNVIFWFACFNDDYCIDCNKKRNVQLDC